MRAGQMNTADIDNLEGAATPIAMDRLLGRPLTPEEQESRNYADNLVRQADIILAQNPGMTRDQAMTLVSQAGVDARAAERAKTKTDRMVRFGRDYYEATGAPQWATDQLVESLGGEVEEPPAGSFVPMVELTPEEKELQAWRDSNRAATDAEIEQYGRGYDGVPLTPSQQHNRSQQRMREANRRHSPYEEQQRIRRQARRAGVTEAEAYEMVQGGYDKVAEDGAKQPYQLDGPERDRADKPTFDEFARAQRALVGLGNDRLDAQRAARQAEVVARAQRQYNPMATLSPEWRDFVMAERLLRDSRNAGASPTDVQQAAEQAKAAMESRLGTGAGFQPRSPEEQRILQDRADADQRQNNPQAAGMRDIQEGKFETEEARDVLKNLAKPYDTVWFGGAPEEAFPDIKARLMGAPYNLPEAQADIAAREAMRQTNWW